MIKNLVERIAGVKSVFRVNGFVETVKLVWSTLTDFNFDHSIGIKTSEIKFVKEPVEFNGKKLPGSYYLPTRGKPFRDFLAFCNFSKEMTFVDIGCGRGRVLWLAKSFGFKKVVGIEIDAELAAEARANLLKKGLIENKEFEVLNMNVSDYLPQSEENIYYFYGPFIAEDDLKKAVQSLAKKKLETGRDQFVAYHCNIVGETQLDRFAEVKKEADMRFTGNRFFLYKLILTAWYLPAAWPSAFPV